jgi:D-sedoheptulose 7-phosphate isomerase
MDFIQKFLNESTQIIQQLDTQEIELAINILKNTKHQHGRLFILGVGGSAANASHAVNDFRKIVGLEAYAPTDNVSELTARTNDEGWESVFVKWLETSKLNEKDCILVLSVGGGNLANNISPNLIAALKYAKQQNATIIGIVGRDGGFTKTVSDACILIPTISADNITPHAEAFQGIIWHLLVSHPQLKLTQTKWESVCA